MRGEIIETGKTVEEAINSACQKLGCERENCEWEIIDLPKKSFLGLKNIPAKVKVSVELPDQEPPKEPPVVKAAPPPRSQEKKPERQPQQGQAQSKPKKQIAKQDSKGKPDSAPAQRRPENDPPRTPESAPAEAPVSEEVKAKADIAGEYLVGIVDKMGLKAGIDQIWEENGVCLSVKGEGLGAIIGRRGETLDALQYLAGLVANRQGGDYLRVSVDCGDYRVKRKETLEALARKIADQVIKTGSSKSLEPMKPFERRIIHATVSSIGGVSSTSVGEEPTRRVVISSLSSKGGRRSGSGDRQAPAERTRGASPGGGQIADKPDWPDKPGGRPRGGGPRERGRGGDRDRRGGRDRERKPSYQPTKEAPDTPPTEAANKPLYGKIDLD